MTRLMKLELKKISLKKYVLFSIIGFFICMFFIFVGLTDSSAKAYDYELSFSMIGLIFCFYYIILFAVLVAAYIVDEYTHKTILVMFSCPVDRRKLILAKLLLITALVMTSMMIGYICCGVFIVCVDKYLNLVAGGFQLSLLSRWIPTAVKAMIMFGCFGMWTFIVGMIKKSVPMTIVSAIIFCYIRQFILAGTNTREENWFLVIGVAAVTAAGVYYTLNHKVKQID